AFIYNNSAVVADYREPGPGREAFKRLLENGVVIPYLLGEPTPNQRPRFTTNPEGLAAWMEVCQEVRMRCLRLSWDDQENLDYVKHQLEGRFGHFAQTLNRLDLPALQRDLGLPPESDRAFKDRLTEVARKCVDWSGADVPIRREELYKEFVVADGSNPAEGKYDRRKPFAAEIKQLLDLNYNVNLPDAIGKFPLTPTDTLHRTALQEWKKSEREQRELSPDELLELLRRAAFDLVQGSQYIKSLGSLSLKEIIAIRESWQWVEYTRAIQELMDDPLAFQDPDRGAAAVYSSYVRLAGLATEIAKKGRRQKLEESWIPGIELVVEVAGAVISVLWGGERVVKTAGEISKQVGDGPASVVVRLVVRGLTEMGSRADLATSVDFMRGRFDRAQTRWGELLSGLGKLSGFEHARAEVEEKRPANIDYSEELYR
ncbi:MAG: hypothetical protein M3217_09580, partial [Actinomycetota bacterium]|nr:hypothetical protein [Actinomycetota bacterium]